MFQPVLDVVANHQGVLSRRGFMRNIGGASVAAACALGWHDLLVARAAELRKSGKSMILLWMDGGPSQFDTFNPKIGSENQGPTKAIKTTLPGIEFGEHWPQTAAMTDKITLIRSMRSKEAEHDRAITLVRTGYPPSPAIRYPTFGSVVMRQIAPADFDLPSFVRIGKPRIATRDVDSGVLGARYSVFKINEAGKLPENVASPVAPEVLKRRLALSDRFDSELAEGGAPAVVKEKKEVYDRTSRFVLSPRIGAFDLSGEPDKLRDAYGRTNFGQGCLLARRLVEQGVSFVEVISTGSRNDQGWDTHKTGNTDNPHLAGEVDPAYATLLQDLSDRGMLENTLVVWMGEFGRTPKIKADGGRDHYPEGWQCALSGGGIRTGQVIGATDSDGVKVTDRPVGVQDLFVSFCKVLGINPHEEYVTSDNRPLKLVEGGEIISELGI